MNFFDPARPLKCGNLMLLWEGEPVWWMPVMVFCPHPSGQIKVQPNSPPSDPSSFRPLPAILLDEDQVLEFWHSWLDDPEQVLRTTFKWVYNPNGPRPLGEPRRTSDRSKAKNDSAILDEFGF